MYLAPRRPWGRAFGRLIFRKQGKHEKSTWPKMGSKEKGPPGDASYAGRAGVHYLHRRAVLKGEKPIKTKIMEHVGFNWKEKN